MPSGRLRWARRACCGRSTPSHHPERSSAPARSPGPGGAGHRPLPSRPLARPCALLTPAGREFRPVSGTPRPSAVLYELNPEAAGWSASTWAAGGSGPPWPTSPRRDRPADERAQVSAPDLIGHIARHRPRAGHRGRHRLGPGCSTSTVGSLSCSSRPGARSPSPPTCPAGPPGPGAALRNELGDRIGVENDVNLAAEGERWRGLGTTSATSASCRWGRASAWAWCLTASCSGGPARRRRGRYLPIGADPYDPRSAAAGAFEERVNGAAWSGRPARPASRSPQRQEGVPLPAGRPAGRRVVERGPAAPSHRRCEGGGG